MKKLVTYRLLISLLLLFTSPITLLRADNDDVLERIIYIGKTKATVYASLEKVSEQSGYLFIYDNKIVDNERVIKLKKGYRTIRQAIMEITGRRNLHLRIIGNHILITSAPAGEATKSVSSAEIIPDSLSVLTVQGTLLDKQSGEPVINGTVGIKSTSIGSVTNQEGAFKLLIPDSLKDDSIVFSHVGYTRQELAVSLLTGRDNILTLDPKVIPLQEVVIRWVNPHRLLRDMLNSREKNNASQPSYLTTFYREGVEYKNKLQNFTEAVFKIYKTPVLDQKEVTDQVKLLKMSRISNRGAKDTLLAKMSAGIHACLQLDLIKILPDFLTPDSKDNVYDYTSGGVTMIDNHCANIICFEQKKRIKEPYYCGELYIDSENNALLKARIELQPAYIKKASGLLVEKQSKNLHITSQKVVYTITYKPWKGIYYIHHIRGDLHFKVRKKPLAFTTPALHTWFEMVTCKIENEQATRFPRAERLPLRTILSDMDYKYDSDFWGDFNVIPLEEELSKVIEKMSLKIELIE